MTTLKRVAAFLPPSVDAADKSAGQLLSSVLALLSPTRRTSDINHNNNINKNININNDISNDIDSEMLHDYRLREKIGEGAFAKVFIATHAPTQENVAIKALSKKHLEKAQLIERALKEIVVMRHVGLHPNVCTLLQVIDSPDTIYLVMEYCPNGELFDWIEKNDASNREEEAKKIFAQLVAAVQHCHAKNVVHRDIKPENLLLGEDNTVKIADFGLSNFASLSSTPLNSFCGSVDYTAPEMLAGKPYKGLEVDIWALGVVLFALVCGYSPFYDPHTPRMYTNIIIARYKLPEHVSSEFRAFINRILKVDPKQRPSLDDIASDPWVAPACTHLSNSSSSSSSTELTNLVIEKLLIMNYDLPSIRAAIATCEPSALFASYYLLKQRYGRYERDKIKEELLETPREQDRDGVVFARVGVPVTAVKVEMPSTAMVDANVSTVPKKQISSSKLRELVIDAGYSAENEQVVEKKTSDKDDDDDVIANAIANVKLRPNVKNDALVPAQEQNGRSKNYIYE